MGLITHQDMIPSPRAQSSILRPQSAICNLSIADCRLLTANFRLPTVRFHVKKDILFAQRLSFHPQKKAVPLRL